MQSSIWFLYNVTFWNAFSIKGGAITIMQEAVLNVVNSKFFECKSGVGTIIYSVNSLSRINITGVLIERCSVSDMALFFLLFSEISVKGLKLTQNQG